MHNLGKKWLKFDIFPLRVCDISLKRIFYVHLNKINQKLIIYNSLPHFTRFYGYIQLVYIYIYISKEQYTTSGWRVLNAKTEQFKYKTREDYSLIYFESVAFTPTSRRRSSNHNKCPITETFNTFTKHHRNSKIPKQNTSIAQKFLSKLHQQFKNS